MSDITFCENNKCPINSICQRFLDNRYIPLYASFFKPDFNNNDCEYFIGDDNQKELMLLHIKRKSNLNKILRDNKL